jgi:hypothetical protein
LKGEIEKINQFNKRQKIKIKRMMTKLEKKYGKLRFKDGIGNK